VVESTAKNLIRETNDMTKDNKLDEQVLGFASVGRLQKLAGIHSNLPIVKQIDEEDDKKPDEDGDGVPDWADKKSGKDDKEAVNEDEFDGIDDFDDDPVIDPMGDSGMPGELGDEPVEEPFDPEMDDMAPELDDMPGDDMGPDMDDDMVSMDDLPSVEPEPMMPDSRMDMGMGSDMVGDVRSEMESNLDSLLSSAPNLKIADFKDVLHHAEEVVAQIRAMGAQYLKEGRVTRRNANKTLREGSNASGSGFRKSLFEVNTIVSDKKYSNKTHPTHRLKRGKTAATK